MRITTREVLIGVVLFATGIFIAAMLATSKPWIALLLNERYAVVWSGIFGALIAAGVSLIGVRAANSSSLERLRVQHLNDAAEADKQRAHDAKQKDEDRKAAIRREVYTKAAEDAHMLIEAIGSLPDRPLADRANDAKPLQSFLRGMSKVWLVAEADAAHQSREFVGDMAELFMLQLREAMPIRLALGPIPDLDNKLEHAEKEFARITQWLNELHETNATEQAKMLANESWTRNNNLVDALRKEKDRLIASVRDRRFAVFKSMWAVMMPAQMKMVSLISSLRKELNLPADEEEFLAQHRDAQSRSWAMVCRMYGVTEDGVTRLNP